MGRCGRARPGRTGCAAPSSGAAAAARTAHRDLDAICALFEAAARAEEQQDHTGVGGVPRRGRGAADPRRHARRARRTRRRRAAADRTPLQRAGVAARGRGAACRRAAGPTCAGAARCCRPTGSAPTGWSTRCRRKAMLAEERRLFYVAVTRARQRLHRHRRRVAGGRR
ncbi:MAG: 3'-5' exonuclease [Nocardioidaceae bacterium]